jgi:hypothetical protein
MNTLPVQASVEAVCVLGSALISHCGIAFYDSEFEMDGQKKAPEGAAGSGQT